MDKGKRTVLEKRERTEEGKDCPDGEGKRPGSAKRNKTASLEIHKEVVIAPEHIPNGSKFKDYQDWVVQNLVIAPCNTLYRLEHGLNPDLVIVSDDAGQFNLLKHGLCWIPSLPHLIRLRSQEAFANTS